MAGAGDHSSVKDQLKGFRELIDADATARNCQGSWLPRARRSSTSRLSRNSRRRRAASRRTLQRRAAADQRLPGGKSVWCSKLDPHRGSRHRYLANVGTRQASHRQARFPRRSVNRSTRRPCFLRRDQLSLLTDSVERLRDSAVWCWVLVSKVDRM
jgi:hypothetical protein